MLSPRAFFDDCTRNGIRFFTGVPDSLLQELCAYITDHAAPRSHVITANEGNAVAVAIGHYLATGEAGLVYMQNSGFGNAVNPLVSLADPLVYGVPVLLIIGWRGEEGVPDEPQHKKQGAITLPLLETMHIPYTVLPPHESAACEALQTAVTTMRTRSAPYALVVREKTFEPYASERTATSLRYALSREEALREVMRVLPPDAVYVSTTGKLSRELFELRSGGEAGHQRDFLTVGGMGHASSIAFGIALAKPERRVYCLDGDGAAIMHLGAQGVIGQHRAQNFRHIIFNNEAHDSVGGQPTAAASMDFAAVAKACGYEHVYHVETAEGLARALTTFEAESGPSLLVLCVKSGARKDLGRPTRTPAENKKEFMEYLHDAD